MFMVMFMVVSQIEIIAISLYLVIIEWYLQTSTPKFTTKDKVHVSKNVTLCSVWLFRQSTTKLIINPMPLHFSTTLTGNGQIFIDRRANRMITFFSVK